MARALGPSKTRRWIRIERPGDPHTGAHCNDSQPASRLRGLEEDLDVHDGGGVGRADGEALRLGLAEHGGAGGDVGRALLGAVVVQIGRAHV